MYMLLPDGNVCLLSFIDASRDVLSDFLVALVTAAVAGLQTVLSAPSTTSTQ